MLINFTSDFKNLVPWRKINQQNSVCQGKGKPLKMCIIADLFCHPLKAQK